MRTWLVRQFGNTGSLRRQLVRGGAGSFALKITHLLIAFGVTVLLARFLGPEGYGVYAYVLALVNVLVIPAQFGLPVLVVRETAASQVGERWGEIQGLWRWSTLIIVALSAGIVGLALVIAGYFSQHFTWTQLATFSIGVFVIPFLALSNLRAAALRGLRKVVQSQLPEEIVRPLSMILLVGLFLLAVPTDLSPAHGMAFQLIATVVAYLVGVYLLRSNKPSQICDIHPAYRSSAWISSALPLALSAGTLLLTRNIDIIMLGWFAPSEEVGSYRVAVQVAMLAAFGLKAINMVVAPYFARMYRAEDYRRLQKIATASARSAFLFSFPLVVIFVLYGEYFIIIVFGDQFSQAAMPLLILAVAQLINSSVGSVGYLMNMTGNELAVTRAVAIALALNIILNILLIPEYQGNGAALATAVSLATWNLILWVECKRRLGVDSSIFGIGARGVGHEAP